MFTNFFYAFFVKNSLNPYPKLRLLSLLFFSCSQNTQIDNYNENVQFGDYPAKSDNDCENARLWDYSVKPGMDEWAKFQSNEEMVYACQIPENILLCLSTEDLIDLCLRYPLLTDFFVFESLNTGLDKLFSDFNGIRELYKREDVSSSLLKRYNEKIQSFSHF